MGNCYRCAYLISTTAEQPTFANIPMMAGAVALIYNIPEINPTYQLILSRAVIVDIYERKITKWNDPKIAELNPIVADSLPNESILLLHRFDESGTAYVLSKAIQTFSPYTSIIPSLKPTWVEPFATTTVSFHELCNSW